MKFNTNKKFIMKEIIKRVRVKIIAKTIEKNR